MPLIAKPAPRRDRRGRHKSHNPPFRFSGPVASLVPAMINALKPAQARAALICHPLPGLVGCNDQRSTAPAGFDWFEHQPIKD